jgi:hypothetical protein
MATIIRMLTKGKIANNFCVFQERLIHRELGGMLQGE